MADFDFDNDIIQLFYRENDNHANDSLSVVNGMLTWDVSAKESSDVTIDMHNPGIIAPVVGKEKGQIQFIKTDGLSNELEILHFSFAPGIEEQDANAIIVDIV